MIKKWLTTGMCVSSLSVSLIGTLVNRALVRQTDKVEQDIRNLPAPYTWPRVSVLVPARNEEDILVDSLSSILNQDYPLFEVIVVDDQSTDRTPQLLQDVADRFPSRLRIISAPPLPKGWLGKPHALWVGFEASDPNTDYLLFVDADTHLAPDALRNAVSYAMAEKIDLLSRATLIYGTSLIAQAMRLQLDMFYVYAALDPLFKGRQGFLSGEGAAGPFMLARRTAYVAVGGHKAVKGELLEDAALAHAFRERGFATVFRGANTYVSQNPTRGLGAYWQSERKGWFLTIHKDWAALVFVLFYEWFFGLLPFILLFARIINRLSANNKKQKDDLGLLLNLAAVGSVFVQHADAFRLYYRPRYYALLYPIAAVLSSFLVLDSAIRLSFGRSVRWKDRAITVPGNTDN